ncbi:hypothetical protein [Thalassospira australica]|uniref:hypothetical protein n=1 Tax=Thalassospira australica TaxID=1528106 RepID=UPI00384E0C63
MSIDVQNKMLKTVLMLDAATCLAFGLLLCIGNTFLARLLGLPADLLFYAGMILFPCTVLMFVTGRQACPHSLLVRLIVMGNLGWALASIAVLIVPVGTPTVIGYGFVIVQALAVMGIAALEYRFAASHSLSAAS